MMAAYFRSHLVAFNTYDDLPQFFQAQIFNQLEFLGNDNHPDAHACRLKLSAVTVGLGDSSAMKCPWSVFEEMR